MTAPRLLVIQTAADDPVGRLGDWLSAAGLHLDVLRPYEGAALPADLSGCSGLLVLGGGMSATDDAATPWLPEVRALLRDAVSREVPTLGVCLGAQLLATAAGGRVGPNPAGPEFGAQLIAKRAACAGDPLFGPVPITPDVIQWHFDEVHLLPPGAVLLASSPGCDIQAFRLGRLAWGVQFHIETTPELVRAWAATDARHLEGYDVELLLSRSDAVHEDLAEVWQPFAAAFADVLRDPAAVALLRAVPTSSAEPITDAAAIRAALAEELSASRGGPAVLPMPGLRQPGHD
ncbi:MAG: type 1 glutamine amidotransferase [Actinomycetota bacterium]|nr:type 1 glutamine amidotransferase [Actinomycetota bacterium]